MVCLKLSILILVFLFLDNFFCYKEIPYIKVSWIFTLLLYHKMAFFPYPVILLDLHHLLSLFFRSHVAFSFYRPGCHKMFQRLSSHHIARICSLLQLARLQPDAQPAMKDNNYALLCKSLRIFYTIDLKTLKNYALWPAETKVMASPICLCGST